MTPISLLLPADAPPEAFLSEAELRAWWSSDTTIVGDRVSPGLDAPEMRVAREGDVVTWTGEVLVARFSAGRLEVEALADDIAEDDRDELVLAWEIALRTLGWALGAPRPVAWRRVTMPLALAYTDAWGRIDGPEGIAGGQAGETVTVRIAGGRVTARVALSLPPRAVVLDLGRALLRVSFGPGESVNGAFVDLLGDPATLPAGWEEWVTRRFGMTWLAQLGEDG